MTDMEGDVSEPTTEADERPPITWLMDMADRQLAEHQDDETDCRAPLMHEVIRRLRLHEARATAPAGLREAAEAVVKQADPDDDFDGQFIEYLVPFEAIDALRAALAADSEPVE